MTLALYALLACTTDDTKDTATDTGADNLLPANDHVQIFNGSTNIN